MRYFGEAVSRGLPIYTDGYSILIARLRQLSRRASSGGHGPASATRAAAELLDRASPWAAFTDFSAPTVTFRASNPARPELQQPVEAADGLIQFRGTVQVH